MRYRATFLWPKDHKKKRCSQEGSSIVLFRVAISHSLSYHVQCSRSSPRSANAHTSRWRERPLFRRALPRSHWHECVDCSFQIFLSIYFCGRRDSRGGKHWVNFFFLIHHPLLLLPFSSCTHSPFLLLIVQYHNSVYAPHLERTRRQRSIARISFEEDTKRNRSSSSQLPLHLQRRRLLTKAHSPRPPSLI